jgi:hypothetical protein
MTHQDLRYELRDLLAERIGKSSLRGMTDLQKSGSGGEDPELYVGFDAGREGVRIVFQAGAASSRYLAIRVVIAVAIIILLIGYTGAIVAGGIAPNHQLSSTYVALLALGAVVASLIIWPSALYHIKSFSAGGIRLDLEKVERRQDQFGQFEQQLITQILPFLIPEPVFKHLKNLEASEQGRSSPADKYRGNDHLRGELRALRDLGLIRVAPGRTGIGNVPDSRFDLVDYVTLTDRGREWTRKVHLPAPADN